MEYVVDHSSISPSTTLVFINLYAFFKAPFIQLLANLPLNNSALSIPAIAPLDVSPAIGLPNSSTCCTDFLIVSKAVFKGLGFPFLISFSANFKLTSLPSAINLVNDLTPI